MYGTVNDGLLEAFVKSNKDSHTVINEKGRAELSGGPPPVLLGTAAARGHCCVLRGLQWPTESAKFEDQADQRGLQRAGQRPK